MNTATDHQPWTEPPRSYLALAGFLALSLGVGAAGGLMTSIGLESWYGTLVRPGFTPPDAVFGPVWTVLYVLIAISGWRVWRLPTMPGKSRALALYAVQLAFNLAWPGLFFAAGMIGAAFICILLLLAAIIATCAAFIRLDRPAAWLLVPYLAWTGFAAVLNFGFWWLN